MNTPNEEQLLAIDVNGGVLSAGAGSGKTFVIVEHTIRKILNVAQDKFLKNDPTWIDQFLVETSRIALLTFTKKAAAEMRDRLKIRAKDTVLPEFLSSKILIEAIDGVFVGTIHAFLLRLVKEGAVPGIEEPEIISQKIFEQKLTEYVEESVLKLNKNIGDELYSIVLTNLSSISKSFIKIFNDPELRLKWEAFESDLSFDDFWCQFYQVNNVEKFLGLEIGLEGFGAHSDKTWYKAIKDLNIIFENFKLDSFEDHFYRWIDFFDAHKRIVKPKKINDEAINDFLDCIKVIRSAFKDAREHLTQSINNIEILRSFNSLILGIFDEVNDKINFKKDLTFSTLEYLVYKNKEIQPMLSYLLVDEFQDTSWIQYEIIKRLTESGMKDIFCVGDQKQAIYRFRGGEIGVFEKTIKQSHSHLKLSNNYRSCKDIVEFNNSFFSKVFSLGLGFIEQNNFRLNFEMNPQSPQVNDVDVFSEVKGLRFFVNSNEAKISSAQREIIEAKIILEQIKTLGSRGETEVAVLYSRLAPSYYLLRELSKNETTFISQTKLPYSEQPIYSIALLIIEHALGFYASDIIPKRNLEEILGFIGVKTDYDFSRERLINNYKYFGARFALLKEFSLLGVSVSDKKNTLELIFEGIECSDGKLENLWIFLNDLRKQTYSFEYRSKGRGSLIVHIMSVHSSKGLEFDNVLLGGIHTNGKSIVDDSLVKKWPGSIKWMPDLNSKKLWKSPSYVLESIESKNLDFNEQKRLLYVACTRAKRTLYFPFIYDLNKNCPSSSSKNSWVNAISGSELEFSFDDIDNIETTVVPVLRKTPLFHYENFGMIKRKFESTRFNLSVDHSVTGLSDLFFCSRKYYLSNVCKLGENSIEFIDNIHTLNIPEQYQKFIKSQSNELISSDKERGSKYHRLIEDYILKNRMRDNYAPDELGTLSNCFDLIDQVDPGKELFPEHPIKFKFNGQFVNGVCDLIVLDPARRNAEIWDFKTGSKNEFLIEKYLGQLKLYACGLLELFDQLPKVDLKLIYIDKSEVISFTFDRQDILELSTEVSNKISSPWLKSDEKCQHCEYKKVCLVKLTNC